MTKIKVLQVIPKLGYGGAETGCYDIAHYLAEKDCKIVHCYFRRQTSKICKKKKLKFFVYRYILKIRLIRVLFNAINFIFNFN